MFQRLHLLCSFAPRIPSVSLLTLTVLRGSIRGRYRLLLLFFASKHFAQSAGFPQVGLEVLPNLGGTCLKQLPRSGPSGFAWPCPAPCPYYFASGFPSTSILNWSALRIGPFRTQHTVHVGAYSELSFCGPPQVHFLGSTLGLA